MSLAGKLIVASPVLVDPNFTRSVVLILEDNSEGSMGLVLNRPTSVPVGDHLPGWVGPAAAPEVVFVGGPVIPEVAIGLGADPATPPETWAPVFGDIGLVDVSNHPEFFGGLRAARIYAGYAGWLFGQLLAEVAIESWVVCEPQIEDIFDDEPDGMWRRVLARQDGRGSLYSTYPDDLSRN